MPTTSKKTTKKKATKKRHVLLCSFCGKNQHEVRKLIAGPSVFICDECTETCRDIVDEEIESSVSTKNGRDHFNLNLTYSEPITETEEILLPMLIGQLETGFPECRIRFTKLEKDDLTTKIRINVDAPSNYFTTTVDELRDDIRRLAAALRTEQQKYIAEKSRSEILAMELRDFREKMFPLLVRRLEEHGEWSKYVHTCLSVLFLDLVGFSKMDEGERKNVLEMLRGISKTILTAHDGGNINTWGDAIIASFADPNAALACGCMFIRHLSVAKIDARVGISWGNVRVSNNALTGKLDVDGDSVNVGARLEQIADTGEVLVTEDFAALSEIDKTRFHLSKCTRELKKSVGKNTAGSDVVCFSATLIDN